MTKEIAALVVGTVVSFFAAVTINSYIVADRGSALFNKLHVDNVNKVQISFTDLLSEMRHTGNLACVAATTLTGIAAALVLVLLRRK